MTLNDLIPNLKRKTKTEYAGPCPFCGGEDRFIVTPAKDLWWCRQCNRSGDTIQYKRDVLGMSFNEAKGENGMDMPVKQERQQEEVRPYQTDLWQDVVSSVMQRARLRLDGEDRAYRWLAARGIDEATAIRYGLGYISQDMTYKGFSFYKGLAIPNVDLYGRITAVKIRTGKGKYVHVKGGAANRLYGLAKSMVRHVNTLVVESELDVLTIKTLWPKWINAVATGGTNGGKADTDALLKLVAGNPQMLWCAFDADQAGDAGYKAFWEPMGVRRLRPVGAKDVGEMYQECGREKVIEWVVGGIE